MNYEESPNKEKRIAFLSIFSSICRTGQIDTKTAKEVVDSLFKEYPINETKPMQANTKPMQTQTNSKPNVKQTTEQCPSCGKAMKEIEGNSFSNYYKKMVHYRMLVCPDSNKEGTGPCQQKPIKLPVFEPKQMERSSFEDQLTDEANNPPEEYGNHYDRQ